MATTPPRRKKGGRLTAGAGAPTAPLPQGQAGFVPVRAGEEDRLTSEKSERTSMPPCAEGASAQTTDAAMCPVQGKSAEQPRAINPEGNHLCWL